MYQLPDFIFPGAIIKLQGWVGVIVDIALSKDKAMLLIKSPKNAFRARYTEWLEYNLLPDEFSTATLEEFVKEVEVYKSLAEKKIRELEALRDEVSREGSAQ